MPTAQREKLFNTYLQAVQQLEVAAKDRAARARVAFQATPLPPPLPVSAAWPLRPGERLHVRVSACHPVRARRCLCVSAAAAELVQHHQWQRPEEGPGSL